jgi:hypothetical protein
MERLDRPPGRQGFHAASATTANGDQHACEPEGRRGTIVVSPPRTRCAHRWTPQGALGARLQVRPAGGAANSWPMAQKHRVPPPLVNTWSWRLQVKALYKVVPTDAAWPAKVSSRSGRRERTKYVRHGSSPLCRDLQPPSRSMDLTPVRSRSRHATILRRNRAAAANAVHQPHRQSTTAANFTPTTESRWQSRPRSHSRSHSSAMRSIRRHL